LKGTLEEKYHLLKKALKDLGSVVVAFSGGVDSSFLLKASFEALGHDAIGVTMDSPTLPEMELERAKEFCKKYGIRHIVQKSSLGNKKFIENDRLRCYYCKKDEMKQIKKIAQKYHSALLDGQNLDDEKDYRPGSLAASELGAISLLKECGLKKDEIRALSKRSGITSWDRPASACLASRIDYGIKITEPLLKTIDHLETFLRKKGFKLVRVRHHGKIARIELGRNELADLFKKGLSQTVLSEFKKHGYCYVVLDIEGYRMGSMNMAVG